MSNKLLNPDFTNGTESWENGPSDYPFYWDPTYKWIRGDSPATQDYKVFTIQQGFNIADTIILAKLTAWRRYEAINGNYVQGAVKSRIKLQKPDSSWVTLVEETKTAETGSGNILDQYDILSHFSTQGNYKLMLQTESRSGCDRSNNQASVTNPYGPWENNGFTISDPNCYVPSDPYSQDAIYAKISKSFEILGPTHTATLTLDAKGVVISCPLIGSSRFKVSLERVGWSTDTLYDGYLASGGWETILSNLDIKSYLVFPGSYNLILESWVVSGYDGDETYYPSEAWYGACYLNAQWYSYQYTQSKGYWDEINLDILRKVFKTVVESIGCKETPTKKISIFRKEGVKLTESYSYLRVLLKEVKESIGVKESFSKKIFKIVKESVSCKEYYTMGRPKIVQESIFLAESFSWRKLIRKTIQESVAMKESLTAKRTAGNIITTFNITDLTEWQDRTPSVTAWIKEKTIMNT